MPTPDNAAGTLNKNNHPSAGRRKQRRQNFELFRHTFFTLAFDASFIQLRTNSKGPPTTSLAHYSPQLLASCFCAPP